VSKEALTLIEAKRIIGSELKKSSKIKQSSLFEGINHVIAEDVVCAKNFPVLPKSTVDGFVVSSKREKYVIKGEISLNVRPPKHLKAEDAYQVYTGSFLPINSLYVIKKEMASINQGMLLPVTEAAFEKNFIDAGEDCKKGETVIKKGEVLSPRVASFLSMTGIKKVKVYQMPKVGILPIGTELLGRTGPDLTGFVIKRFAESMIASAELMAPVPDSVAKISEAILKLAKKYDVLLTIGGTGASNRDLTTDAVLASGGRPVFKGVKIQPGRTTGFFIIKGKPLVTLPGNAQAAVSAFFIILPEIFQKMGFATMFPKEKVILKKSIDVPEGWIRVFFAKILNHNGCKLAEILDAKPHTLRFLLESDALLIISERVNEGSLVDALLI